ncbi:CASP-like protein 4A3 [Striga hermonthica]|uniref:CASP-like protein n=1 Tax=Striga hermonthica TaxID=68872 RepID=A0A9N7RMB6_STRHE|nr:CASP-like protein 4A3 [Striga hermonthica]
MESPSEPSKNHSTRNGRHSKSHLSMSDTESTTSQVDSFHSPLRSDEPPFPSENDDPGVNNCRSIVLVDNYKYNSPLPSPAKSNPTAANSPFAGGNFGRPWPPSEKLSPENPDSGSRRSQHRPPAAVVGVNKLVREEPPYEVKKMGPSAIAGGGLEEGYGAGGWREDEVGGERRSRAAVASILRRSGRNAAVKKVALGLRAFEVVACLVSFSVMAADRTRGWSGDSFDRYIEYRYCVAVNVIAFVYSGFQSFEVAYHLATGKLVIVHQLRHLVSFTMDQILAYLLMSASSSAATRVDDWISNWGGDEFTLMASASIAMSFLAFVAFALSSLVSGYNLCNWELT